MSEKYSMNELLAWIEKQCSLVDAEWGCASSCEDECRGPKDAIIARLRAADKLCGAAKLAVVEIPAPTPDSLMTFKIDGSIDGLRKAIAEYERKA